MSQPQQPMTTKYYFISSKHPSDVSSSLTHQPNCPKLAPPSKVPPTFPAFPRVLCEGLQEGAGLPCSSFGLSAKPLHVASVVNDSCEVDAQRHGVTISLTWCCGTRVLSLSLATQSKAKTSSLLVAYSREQFHITSANMGVGWRDGGKYQIGNYIQDRACVTSPSQGDEGISHSLAQSGSV